MSLSLDIEFSHFVSAQRSPLPIVKTMPPVAAFVVATTTKSLPCQGVHRFLHQRFSGGTTPNCIDEASECPSQFEKVSRQVAFYGII